MASKKNRKLGGVVLTGALIAPAVMSAAQQNVASADLSSSLKKFGSWALDGIKAAWSNTYVQYGLIALAIAGFIGLEGLVAYKLSVGFDDDDESYKEYNNLNETWGEI